MKKAIPMFCAALALCLTLTGCRAFHDHTWSFDYKNHWSDCECGTKIEPAAHNLHENICIACGAKILSFDDFGVVQTYDEHGSIKTSDEYSSSGDLIREDIYDWEYDENGSPTSCRVYSNGVLSQETRSFLGPDGKLYDSSRITYNADGSIAGDDVYVHEFDDQGNLCYSSRSIGGMTVYERFYKLDPDGEVYLAHEICYWDNGARSVEFIHELDSSGRDYLARCIEYGEDGSITAERRYDDQGNEIE